MRKLHKYAQLYVLRVFLTLIFLSVGLSSDACTVFILTDGRHTHFFNNEDYTDPRTNIWFIPKGKGHYGSAYVGFSNGEAQGGVNTEGLAFDWVTVDNDSYETDPGYIPGKHLLRLNGDLSQRMLEQCRTVDEAIRFFQTYREPAFAKTTIVIADRSGASVIIGSKNGKLYFERSRQSRGLGYGESTFKKLSKGAQGHDAGADILKQCVAPGESGTKYSNSYNLTTGEIVFYNFTQPGKNTKLNLLAELKKGGHYYETSVISTQSVQPPKPLLLNMNRHILFNYKPLYDQEPKITTKIKNVFSDAAIGKIQYADFSENIRENLKKDEASLRTMFERFGKLKSIELILKEKKQGYVDYSYITKLEKVTILWQFALDDKSKIQDFNSLKVSWIQ